MESASVKAYKGMVSSPDRNVPMLTRLEVSPF